MNSNQFASNEAMAQARAHVDSFAEGDRVVNVRTGKVGTFHSVVKGYGGQPWFAIAFDGNLYRFEADLTMVMPEAVAKVDCGIQDSTLGPEGRDFCTRPFGHLGACRAAVR